MRCLRVERRATKMLLILVTLMLVTTAWRSEAVVALPVFKRDRLHRGIGSRSRSSSVANHNHATRTSGTR